MKKIEVVICLTLFIVGLVGSLYYKIKHEAAKEDLPLQKQVSIFYTTERATKSKLKKLNKHDAIVVSDFLLVQQYQKKGINPPVFFIPFDFCLDEFLKLPLKTHQNPLFIFGHITASHKTEKYVNVIDAFNRAFGMQNNIKLHIYCSSERDLKKLKKVLKNSPSTNISLFDSTAATKSQDAFLQSIDCYVNLSSEECLIRPSCKALALGIPVITSQCDKPPLWNDQLPIMPFSLNGEKSLADMMQDIHQCYDRYLDHAEAARKWAENYERSLQTTIQRMLKNLLSPKKLIFGHEDVAHERYLQTKSRKLYQKYLPQISLPETYELKSLIGLLQPLDPPSIPSGVKGIDCIYVINLDERPARWEAVKRKFDTQKIIPYRVKAINGWKIPKEIAIQLFDQDADFFNYPFGGILGCLLSHVSIYKNALEKGFETIWICEDDIEFKQDVKKISFLIEQLSKIDPEWDILYTDYCSRGEGYQRPRPGHHFYNQKHFSVSKDLLRVHGRFNTHSMIFSKRGLKKVYQYFTNGYLWNAIDIDIHHAPHLKEYSAKENIVTNIYDISASSIEGFSDTSALSSLNCE